MSTYALLKGFEMTKWKDMELVIIGDKKGVLDKFSGRDGKYILWWLVDLDKLPFGVSLNSIVDLFLKTFYDDREGLYKADFIAGFHDDDNKDRSWGLLKK
jgi:hypothetical protein